MPEASTPQETVLDFFFFKAFYSEGEHYPCDFYKVNTETKTPLNIIVRINENTPAVIELQLEYYNLHNLSWKGNISKCSNNLLQQMTDCIYENV